MGEVLTLLKVQNWGIGRAQWRGPFSPMSESVPNRPFRPHDSDLEEPNKRAKMAEVPSNGPQVEDIRGRYVFSFTTLILPHRRLLRTPTNSNNCYNYY